MIRHITDKLSPEEFEAKLARIPLKEQQDKWRTTAKQGYTPEQLEEWSGRCAFQSRGREAAHRDHLAGGRRLLACRYRRLRDGVAARALGGHGEPPGDAAVLRLAERVSARPGVKAALAMPNPVADTIKAAFKN